MSDKIIQTSTSPWSSPIVIIINKDGIDILLCIDYRRVNQLARWMVYPMPLINELLQDMDRDLWYCSLDMANGFWGVEITDRAKMISAFSFCYAVRSISMATKAFWVENAPQMYQSLMDDALYG